MNRVVGNGQGAGGLVDDRGRGQCSSGIFPAKLPVRQTPQLPVDDRHEPVEGRPVAFAPGLQQRRHLSGRVTAARLFRHGVYGNPTPREPGATGRCRPPEKSAARLRESLVCPRSPGGPCGRPRSLNAGTPGKEER